MVITYGHKVREIFLVLQIIEKNFLQNLIAMNTTVKERLIAFIESKGLTKNKFETKCGLSRRYVSNISQSISPAVSERISLVFPELNMGWVLTGKGEMLNTEPSSAEPTQPPVDYMKILYTMSNTISRQEENIFKLTEMVDRLTKQ